LVEALDCTSSSRCVAVGTYTNEGYNQQGLILSIRAKTVSAFRIPVDGGVMIDLSCITAKSCVAAGSANGVSFLAVGSGTAWTLERLVEPSAANGNSQPVTMACTPTGTCAIVGAFYNSNGAEESFLTSGSGSSWTTGTAPLPNINTKKQISDELTSIACPVDKGCVAVGGYAVGEEGSLVGLIEAQ
jgi:hypothetical protein